MIDRSERIRLKIKRAEDHIRELDNAIQLFVDSDPYTIGAKPHPVSAIAHTTLFVAEVRPVPDEISLILGDAIHNIRSALDHLAWQLVEAGGGTPNKQTAFPICDTPQEYTSALGKGEIKRIPMVAERVMFSIQPYNTHDQNLWLLHQLDIVDKHRLLLTVGAIMDKWGIEFSAGNPFWLSDNRFVPLVVGNEITNIPTSTYDRHSHEQFKLGLDVAFSEPEFAQGDLVINTIKKFLDLVDGIIGSFKPFLL